MEERLDFFINPPLLPRRLYFSTTIFTLLIIFLLAVSYIFEVIPFLSEVYFVRLHLINRKHVFKFSGPRKNDSLRWNAPEQWEKRTVVLRKDIFYHFSHPIRKTNMTVAAFQEFSFVFSWKRDGFCGSADSVCLPLRFDFLHWNNKKVDKTALVFAYKDYALRCKCRHFLGGRNKMKQWNFFCSFLKPSLSFNRYFFKEAIYWKIYFNFCFDVLAFFFFFWLETRE